MDFEPVPEQLATDLVAEAQAGAPNEVCGFVLDDWDWVQIPNCHPEPQRHFQMEEQEMLAVLTHSLHKVRGIYHSHPRGNVRPSDNDAVMMQNYMEHGFRFWIVTYNNMYEWRIQRDKPSPVRRDGSTPGPDGMAYPVLTAATPI